MTLDRFYPIFESAAWLGRMLPHGVKLVQLRIKEATPNRLAHEIDVARELCAEHGAQLVVNDHWQEAIEAGCDFVHLGQEDLDDADVPAIRRAGMKLGISTHDHAELERALMLDPDYVALGPIFPTRLKQMAFGPQGIDRITEWKALIGARPLVAIGGFSVERAAPAFAAGADVVSVVTDITLHDDPGARCREWVETTR
ncbi:thiamine phosphate synthase [Maritimibacter sp. 55A14]|uniref:thiamine phosphate synthase n=1 Tax=Maritimibacter sp. 55A14 TaxID=2174844 RepID=UPI000D61E8C9|nr:thiamine phosphate synthase [Maritimibacter sp. 55A14]PWE32810.1 thiamine phosphate synthase [Maritimibacter sp. 55A14]